MLPKCLSRSLILIFIGITAVLLIGCSGISRASWQQAELDDWTNKLFVGSSKSGFNSSGNGQPGTYSVDPLFSDFYLAMGGEKILGPVISPVSLVDGQTRQFVETGLIVFDPRAPQSERFSLAPLGLDLGVDEGVKNQADENEGRVINGHYVIADFLEFYEQLGGARFVGKPITEAQYNASKGRVEQYFENLGFYKLESENKIRLMPYGAFACNKNCRQKEPSNSIPARQPILPKPFLEKTLELGLPFVGKPLTGLHIATDGNQEVIFENLVLFADVDTPNQVVVRPISADARKTAQELTSPHNSDLTLFVEIRDGLGHNVPKYFIEYLDQFGGLEVTGTPISEVFSPEEGIYWQCFSNLCLQFNLNVEGEQRLRPVPLGVEYKTLNYDQARDYTANKSFENLDIKSWEKGTFVSSSDYQEIFVALYEDGKPLKNCEPILIVTMPDGSQHKGYFQPSDEAGQTSIKLQPIDAPNGTLIAYRICLTGVSDELLCVGDNYLIWGSD
jgi:hypothetical protein